jgi:hypothetical protein
LGACVGWVRQCASGLVLCINSKEKKPRYQPHYLPLVCLDVVVLFVLKAWFFCWVRLFLAGDIGVGGREIGYMFGQYKRLKWKVT